MNKELSNFLSLIGTGVGAFGLVAGGFFYWLISKTGEDADMYVTKANASGLIAVGLFVLVVAQAIHKKPD